MPARLSTAVTGETKRQLHTTVGCYLMQTIYSTGDSMYAAHDTDTVSHNMVRIRNQMPITNVMIKHHVV